jgi:hypothetical protein
MANSIFVRARSSVEQRLAQLGIPVEIQRITSTGFAKIGVGRGIFIADKAEDEAQTRSALLASTSQRARSVLLSPVFRDVQPNDRLVADRVTYTITSVETIRPTDVTLAYKVEVI